MTRLRDPFRAALDAIRRALIDEDLAPGQHLPIAEIAASLRLSTSPVREALSRLCGEGLVEEKRGLGYFTRTWPAEDVAGLFQLESAHVELALKLRTTPPLAWDARSGRLHRHLQVLVESAGNEPLSESFQRVMDRLAPVRRFEIIVFAHERRSPVSGSDLVATIEDYYGSRIKAASTLSHHLRAVRSEPGQNIINIV